MIIIYKEIKEGKIEFTKEELEELLGKVRKEGYDEGYSKGYSDGKCVSPITYPTTPTTPVSPNYPYITWGTSGTGRTSGGDIPLNNTKVELS